MENEDTIYKDDKDEVFYRICFFNHLNLNTIKT